jgi:cell division septal protein FtsQ
MTPRRMALIAGLVAASVAGAWVGIPKAMQRLEYFRVRQIEVAGLRFLDERDVVRRLALSEHASIVDPLDAVRKRAAAIPGVVAASVERRLPGTLQVSVLEELPVALTMQEDRLVLLDRHGRVLPFDPAKAPVSLPVVSRDSATSALLATVLRADAEWYGTIDAAYRDGGDVLLELGAQRVRVRPDASLETVRWTAYVVRWLAEQSMGWAELDTRFAGRAFVTLARS